MGGADKKIERKFLVFAPATAGSGRGAQIRAYTSFSLHHALRACDIICFGNRCELGTIETPSVSVCGLRRDLPARRPTPSPHMSIIPLQRKLLLRLSLSAIVFLLLLIFLLQRDAPISKQKVTCKTDDECVVISWNHCGCQAQNIVHRDSPEATQPRRKDSNEECSALCGMSFSYIEKAACSWKGICVPSVCKRYDGEVIDC